MRHRQHGPSYSSVIAGEVIRSCTIYSFSLSTTGQEAKKCMDILYTGTDIIYAWIKARYIISWYDVRQKLPFDPEKAHHPPEMSLRATAPPKRN